MSVADLPDYVREMAINVTVPPAQNYFWSRAESADKKEAKGAVSSAGNVCTITPAKGCKAVLLIVVGTAAKNGDSFKLEALQSGVWEEIIPQIYLFENGHFFFTFPCWKPDQDVGDGANPTVRLTCAGSGPWRGFIIYYEET